jgi:putative MATE family efflux protein
MEQTITPKRDLTTGSVLGNVLYMGIPSMIGFAAMVVYHITDMFWVARIGVAEVAAVTLFGSIAWVLSAINSMVGSGSVAVISRRFGEKDLPGTASAMEQTLVMKFLIGIPMGVVGYFTLGGILGLMTDDLQVVALGIDYGSIYMLGLPSMFTSYTVYTALRGIGEAPKAMYIMLLSTALNMVLDPLLIVYLDLGVRGAATATVISAVTAVTVGVLVLRFNRGNVTIRVRGFRFDFDIMGRILKIGFPPFIESIARSLAHWVMAVFVAHYGTVVVASYGITHRLVEFGIVIAVGLELGASAIVGQNLGAGKLDRAYHSARKAALLAVLITATLSVVEIVFARQILGVFGKSREVVQTGTRVLVFFAVSQPFLATAISISSAFFGSGNTWPPTLTGLLTAWAFQIPLTALVVYVLDWGATAMWTLVVATQVIYMTVMLVWFRLGRWVHREI